MRYLIFALPVVFGVALLAGSLLLFRRERLDARNFAIAIVLSGLVIMSPLIHFLLSVIKGLLGITFTFVLGFGLAILVLMALVIYLILLMGALRNETQEMWQEISLLKAEYEDSLDNPGSGPDD